MNVLVLSGTVGFTRCYIEVFEDSELGEEIAEKRKSELLAMNSGWCLTVERYKIQRGYTSKTGEDG